jgi:hypothetical protein
MRFDRVKGLQRIGIREQRNTRLRTKPFAEGHFVLSASDDDEGRSHTPGYRQG